MSLFSLEDSVEGRPYNNITTTPMFNKPTTKKAWYYSSITTKIKIIIITSIIF